MDSIDLESRNKGRIAEWRDFLDLPVPLSVELGRTKLSVQAILNLGIDSIVQLPRSTGEGVDIFAGAYHMGRGEIIMIEDRTGIRINDIIDPRAKEIADNNNNG